MITVGGLPAHIPYERRLQPTLVSDHGRPLTGPQEYSPYEKTLQSTLFNDHGWPLTGPQEYSPYEKSLQSTLVNDHGRPLTGPRYSLQSSLVNGQGQRLDDPHEESLQSTLVDNRSRRLSQARPRQIWPGRPSWEVLDLRPASRCRRSDHRGRIRGRADDEIAARCNRFLRGAVIVCLKLYEWFKVLIKSKFVWVSEP